MKKVDIIMAEYNHEEIFNLAEKEGVILTTKGKPTHVLISIEEYNRLGGKI